jgi:hypothetical protein
MAHRPVYVVGSVTVDQDGQKSAKILREVREDLPTGLVPIGAFIVAAPDDETAELLVLGAKLHIDFTPA